MSSNDRLELWNSPNQYSEYLAKLSHYLSLSTTYSQMDIAPISQVFMGRANALWLFWLVLALFLYDGGRHGTTMEIAPPKVLPRLFLAVLYLTDSFPRIHNATMAVPNVHIRSRSWVVAKVCGIGDAWPRCRRHIRPITCIIRIRQDERSDR